MPVIFIQNCSRGYLVQELQSDLKKKVAEAKEACALEALRVSNMANRNSGIQLFDWDLGDIIEAGAVQLNAGKERLKTAIRNGHAKEYRLPDVAHMQC